MRRKSASALMTMTLATALLAAPATAEAAPQAGVHPTGPVTLNTTSSTLVDLTTGAIVVCDGGTLEGDVPSNQLPNLVISSGALGDPTDGCIGPVGTIVQLTPTSLPWSFGVNDYVSGVATGLLFSVEFAYHDSSGCDVTISGPAGTPTPANASLTNGTGEFAIDDATNLQVETADADCDPSLISTGDRIAFSATFSTTPTLSYSDA